MWPTRVALVAWPAGRALRQREPLRTVRSYAALATLSVPPPSSSTAAILPLPTAAPPRETTVLVTPTPAWTRSSLSELLRLADTLHHMQNSPTWRSRPPVAALRESLLSAVAARASATVQAASSLSPPQHPQHMLQTTVGAAGAVPALVDLARAARARPTATDTSGWPLPLSLWRLVVSSLPYDPAATSLLQPKSLMPETALRETVCHLMHAFASLALQPNLPALLATLPGASSVWSGFALQALCFAQRFPGQFPWGAYMTVVSRSVRSFSSNQQTLFISNLHAVITGALHSLSLADAIVVLWYLTSMRQCPPHLAVELLNVVRSQAIDLSPRLYALLVQSCATLGVFEPWIADEALFRRIMLGAHVELATIVNAWLALSFASTMSPNTVRTALEREVSMLTSERLSNSSRAPSIVRPQQLAVALCHLAARVPSLAQHISQYLLLAFSAADLARNSWSLNRLLRCYIQLCLANFENQPAFSMFESVVMRRLVLVTPSDLAEYGCSNVLHRSTDQARQCLSRSLAVSIRIVSAEPDRFTHPDIFIWLRACLLCIPKSSRALLASLNALRVRFLTLIPSSAAIIAPNDASELVDEAAEDPHALETGAISSRLEASITGLDAGIWISDAMPAIQSLRQSSQLTSFSSACRLLTALAASTSIADPVVLHHLEASMTNFHHSAKLYLSPILSLVSSPYVRTSLPLALLKRLAQSFPFPPASTQDVEFTTSLQQGSVSDEAALFLASSLGTRSKAADAAVTRLLTTWITALDPSVGRIALTYCSSYGIPAFGSAIPTSLLLHLVPSWSPLTDVVNFLWSVSVLSPSLEWLPELNRIDFHIWHANLSAHISKRLERQCMLLSKLGAIPLSLQGYLESLIDTDMPPLRFSTPESASSTVHSLLAVPPEQLAHASQAYVDPETRIHIDLAMLPEKLAVITPSSDYWDTANSRPCDELSVASAVLRSKGWRVILVPFTEKIPKP
jgi:hypothetical protein